MSIPAKTKLTLEEWKASVRTSSYIREGEQATFHEHERFGSKSVSAGIDKAPSVFLGTYFITDTQDRSLEGTGWHH